MAEEMPEPVGALWAWPVDITQHQRPYREGLLVGQQTGVVGPGGKGEDGGEDEEEKKKVSVWL